MRNLCLEKIRKEKKTDPKLYYFPDLTENNCESRSTEGDCVSPKNEIYTCGCCWCADAI
jgi:hypothetical protein